MAEERFLVRNVFNPNAVKKLATEIHKHDNKFEKTNFVKDILDTLESLEGFKERMDLIAHTLEDYLPQDYEKAIKLLLKSLPPELDNYLEGYESLTVLPLCEYVANKGCEEKYLDVSMNAMGEMTKRSSAEFPIRFFLKKFPQQTIRYINKWAESDNQHLRRLASEGMRPRLPWAQALPAFKKDPTKVIEVLEKLKDDPELYVRRSVANNLNDIAKDNPQVVTTVLSKWAKDASKERMWLITHALRSLIKDGDINALAILGYTKPNIEISDLQIHTPVVQLNEKLNFSFTLKSNADQNVMIDYLIYFMKSNGKLASKTFKLAKKRVVKGETLNFSKQQLFAIMSTRKLYAGKHQVQLQINGKLFEKSDFDFQL